jgi:hypothetical protein
MATKTATKILIKKFKTGIQWWPFKIDKSWANYFAILNESPQYQTKVFPV